MIRLIQSEFRKMLTIRSTYALLGISAAIAAFVSIYVLGYKLNLGASDPRGSINAATVVVSNLILFIALVGALLITHEYRYNTILYTLTTANSRLKVLLSKLVVIAVFAVLATLLVGIITAVGLQIGTAIRGTEMTPQQLGGFDVLWRLMFFGWAYAMLASILAYIIRSQVGTIVALIFLPGPAEALLSMLLKENTKYLPFSSLNAVITTQPDLSHGRAALIVLGYVATGLVVAAVLFKYRDAN